MPEPTPAPHGHERSRPRSRGRAPARRRAPDATPAPRSRRRSRRSRRRPPAPAASSPRGSAPPAAPGCSTRSPSAPRRSPHRARGCVLRDRSRRSHPSPTTGGALGSIVPLARRLHRSAPSARSTATTEVSDRPVKTAKALPSPTETADTRADGATGSWRQRSSPVTASSATITGWVSRSPWSPTSTQAVGPAASGVASWAPVCCCHATLPSARSTAVTVPSLTPTNAMPSSTVTPVRLTPSSGTGGHSGRWSPTSIAARWPSTSASSPSASRGARRRRRRRRRPRSRRRPAPPGGRHPSPPCRRSRWRRRPWRSPPGTEGPSSRATVNACSPDARSKPSTCSGPTTTATSSAITGAERPNRSPGPPGATGVRHACRNPGSGPSAVAPVLAAPPWNWVHPAAACASAAPAQMHSIRHHPERERERWAGHGAPRRVAGGRSARPRHPKRRGCASLRRRMPARSLSRPWARARSHPAMSTGSR